MSRLLVDPDLAAVTAALLHAGARFVVIGGFAVIANSYVPDADRPLPKPACERIAHSLRDLAPA